MHFVIYIISILIGQSVTLNSIPHSYYDGIPEPTTIPVTSDSTTNPVTSDSTTNPVTSDSTTNPGVSTSDNTATHNPTHITNFFTHITKLPGKPFPWNKINLKGKQRSRGDGLNRGQVAGICAAVAFLAMILTLGVIHCVMKRQGVNMFNYLRHKDEPALEMN